jgi:pSer/pThr/pTyr-binding forkhead associated (FHA) protein
MFRSGVDYMIFDSRLEIEVLEGVDKGKKFPLRSKEITLGRKLIPNEKITHWILFNEPTVSRMHAMLIWDDRDEMYVLHHKSKTNPTLVNAIPVEKKELWSGDRVVMGLLAFRISLQAGPLETHIVTEKIEPHFFKDVPRSEGLQQEPWCVEVTAGPDTGTTFPLRSSIVLLGRRDTEEEAMGQNEILLHDFSLPREHLLLVWNAKENTYGVIKVESSTLQSHVRRRDKDLEKLLEINSERHVLLEEGDALILGDTSLDFSRKDLSLARPPERKREAASKTSTTLKEPRKMRSISLDISSRPPITSKSGKNKLVAKDRPSEPEPGTILIWGEPDDTPPRTMALKELACAAFSYDFTFTAMSGPDRGMVICLLKSDLREDRIFAMGRRGVRINDIVFTDDSMENIQARILFKKGKIFIENEYSDTTFTINDDILHHGKCVELCTADRIQMGQTVLVFHDRSCESTLRDFEILVVEGGEEDQGKKWDIAGERLTMGRSEKCEIRIHDEEVASLHAVMTHENGCFYLESLSPACPTVISGLALAHGTRRVLYSGDRIRLSKKSLLLFARRDDS